jgi:membrane associated rhomboid family serine protease
MSFTYVLIAINVAVFLWELATGGDAYPNGAFHDHGQMFRGAVQAGEGWRILSAAFEHFGWAHIGLNMFALWQLGRVNEAVFGRIRFLLIYAIGIVGSGFAINAFEVPREPSAGASGAIFALFGALVAVGLRLGPKGSDLIKSVLPIIVINLVFTFSVPGISIAAHVGGLLSGFLAGLMLYRLPRPLPPAPPEAVAYRNLAHDPRAVVTIDHPPIESTQSQSQSQSQQ